MSAQDNDTPGQIERLLAEGDELAAAAMAEGWYREAAGEAETRRALRNRVVRTGLERRRTHAQLATATGLTRGRIGQIAMGEEDVA